MEKMIETNNIMAHDKMTFDFNDGFGPVPAHRHTNPDGSEGGWVADTAYVAPIAFIDEDALVFGKARVYDHSEVLHAGRVFGSARLAGRACVRDHAIIRGGASIADDGCVRDEAIVTNMASVKDHGCVKDSACVGGGTVVFGYGAVDGRKRLFGNAEINGSEEKP